MKVVGETKDRLSLKKPVNSVGQLYPVLLAKDGQIIDGFHRREDNPDWRTETLEHIDTPEKLLLARAISNWHRRSISREEKVAWVNGLAQLYLDQGLMVLDINHSTSGISANQIVDKIRIELGISHPTVMRFLHDKYKQKSGPSKKTGPRAPASRVINNLTKGRASGNLVARHEREIRSKLLYDKGFREQIAVQIQREALAMEEEEDPEIRALTTMSFNNMVFQYQDALRQLEANPTLNPFNNKEKFNLKKHGIIEKRLKVFKVYLLTPEAEKVLLNIEN